MRVPSTLPGNTVPLIASMLSPGERLDAIAEWMVEPNSERTLMAVTSRSLWVFGHRRRRRSGGVKELEITGTRTMQLADIASIADQQGRSMIIVPTLRVEITWRYGSPTRLFSYEVADARHFVNVLRNNHGLAAAGAPGANPAGALVDLAALLEQGLLDAGEWERAKVMFLGKPVDAQQEAIDLLRQLHELTRAGVLTRGEFNMKKWEILSRTR